MYTFSVAPPPHRMNKPPVQPDRTRRNHVLRQIGHWAAALGLATAFVAILGLVVGPAVLGYRTAVMPSSSGMHGSIDTGDIVISVPRSPQELQVGDVMTFEAPVGDHQLVTHRIVSLDQDRAGRVVVQTQGDAQSEPDPWRTTITDDEVWVAAYVVPQLGHVATATQSVLARYGALSLAVGGVLTLALSLVRGGDGRRRERQPDRRPALRLVGQSAGRSR